jgi:hypothetical protein
MPAERSSTAAPYDGTAIGSFFVSTASAKASLQKVLIMAIRKMLRTRHFRRPCSLPRDLRICQFGVHASIAST